MKRLLMTLLAACLLLASCASAQGTAPDAMTLTAINVGKADCLLLEHGDCLYMIDTGTNQSWGAVSAALRERGVDHLTGVIVTHADGDHAGGVYALASSSITVDAWYTSAWCEKYKESKNPVLLAAAMRGAEVIRLVSGDTLPFADGTLTVLGPTEYADTENNNSVVLLAEAGGGSILLAGDMEYPEEDLLLADGLIPHCTVLKVGNHGENDATSPAFANAVRPQLAVISTNTWEEPDTPAPRVVKALTAVGAKVLVTQNAQAAVQVTVANGSAEAALLEHGVWPEAVSGVRIAAKDNGADTVTLINEGAAVADLSGWYLHSEKGNELFVFPDGAALAPGAQCVVSTLSSDAQGDYVWRQTKVWNAKKSDPAALYDAYGRVMDRLE